MFAVLFISDFALHAVLRTATGDVGRPAALFADTGKKSVLLAATPSARAAGVVPGMTAPQAIARCPALLICTPLPAAEAEARAALHAVAFTLGPLIEDTAPGVCTIDLKGAADRPEPAAAAAVRQLAALGLPASAGIGRTPLLARYAAQMARCDRVAPRESALAPATGAESPTAASADSTLLSAATGVPTASRRRHSQLHRMTSSPLELPFSLPFAAAEEPSAFPAPPTFPPEPVCTIADEAGFLAPLPLAMAEPPSELASVLQTWGLRTCGDFTALPRDEIVRRFGAAGFALWQRACGGEPRPLRPVVPAAQFTAAMDFEQPVETLEPLLFLLRRFLDRLTLELRAAQFVAAELALTLRLEDDTAHDRRFRLPDPTAEPEILFRALHTHLESLQTGAAIVGLELQLEPARPLVRQHGLFDTGLRDPHGFAETLARVAALVSADRVGTPRPADTHRPDAGTLQPPTTVVSPPGPPSVHPVYGPPLRRFRPPLPATLEFSADDRRPAYLHTAQFQGALAEIRGPWRNSGDWWQSDRAWARIEWDIALVTGGLYRLLRVGEEYFVEGEYD